MARHLDYIHETASRPFVWGKDDCATFVLDWVDLVSGGTLGRDWRGNYNDKLTAQQFADNNGGFVQMAQHTLSKRCVKINRKQHQSGDVCIVRNNSNAVMGIVDGDGVFLRSNNGFIMIKTPILKAWRVNG